MFISPKTTRLSPRPQCVFHRRLGYVLASDSWLPVRGCECMYMHWNRWKAGLLENACTWIFKWEFLCTTSIWCYDVGFNMWIEILSWKRKRYAQLTAPANERFTARIKVSLYTSRARVPRGRHNERKDPPATQQWFWGRLLMFCAQLKMKIK